MAGTFRLGLVVTWQVNRSSPFNVPDMFLPVSRCPRPQCVPEEPCGGNDPDLPTVLEPTREELEMCDALEHGDPDDLEPVDAEKTAHDKQAVTTVRTEAVSIAKTKFGIELNSDEAQTVVGLFPKVWYIHLAPEKLLLTTQDRLQVWLENLMSRRHSNLSLSDSLTRVEPNATRLLDGFQQDGTVTSPPSKLT